VPLGASLLAVLLFEVALNATSMFNHSNVRMPQAIERVLRWLLVTPDMHRVHHSILMENALFSICCERTPNSADQRRRLIALLKAGADIHATDKNGVTALHHAVRFRSPVAVKTLIVSGG